MKCPACGSNDAYIGFTDIDCPNQVCKNFRGAKTVAPVNVRPIPGMGGTPQNPPATPAIPIAVPATPYPGTPGPAVATLNVAILKIDRKRNSVEISFVGDGDPGVADKKVRFLWSLQGGPQNVCTLTNRLRYYVDGVDADGQTVYTTQWRCTHDGLMPNDPWNLMAEIFI